MYLSYGKINSPYNLLERRLFNLFLKALAGELVEVFLLSHSSSDAAFATSLLQSLLCSQKSWSEPRFTETQKPFSPDAQMLTSSNGSDRCVPSHPLPKTHMQRT